MKFWVIIVLFVSGSCSNQYWGIKELVQKNCERTIDTEDVVVTKKNTYSFATILNDSIYTNLYYFIIYGSKWDNVFTVGDNKKIYWTNDSLSRRLIYVNSQLKKRGFEIGEVYINGIDSFAIRTRTVEKKYI